MKTMIASAIFLALISALVAGEERKRVLPVLDKAADFRIGKPKPDKGPDMAAGSGPSGNPVAPNTGGLEDLAVYIRPINVITLRLIGEPQIQQEIDLTVSCRGSRNGKRIACGAPFGSRGRYDLTVTAKPAEKKSGYKIFYSTPYNPGKTNRWQVTDQPEIRTEGLRTKVMLKTSHWSPGTYTLFARVDPEQKVPETDEHNNVAGPVSFQLPEDQPNIQPSTQPIE